LPDALRFCYDVAVAGTLLEGSELEIIRVPAHTRCKDCDRAVQLQDILTLCPCGSANLQPPTGGDGLLIRSMEIAIPVAEAS
jgi:hydrogenase nickel incorporation protein HypA/HybF